MADVQCYFDHLSPDAYLAQTQTRLFGEEIDYRPYDIGMPMPAVGNVPTSVVCKPKNLCVQSDLKFKYSEMLQALKTISADASLDK